MSDYLFVDPESLRNTAPSFDSLSGRVADAQKLLSASMTAESGSWGSDETGSTFAEGYVPGSKSALDTLATLIDALQHIGDGLRATADNFEVTDHDHARGIGSLL